MKPRIVLALVVLFLTAAFVACQRQARDSSDQASPTPDGTSPTPQQATQQKVFPLGLRGDLEVPDPGDPDGLGSGVITLDLEKNQVCFEIQVRGIAAPSAAHIHVGKKGVAGDIVVTLDPPPTSGISKGCIDTPIDLIQKILATPSDYYVNVHNSEFPNGALRAQLA